MTGPGGGTSIAIGESGELATRILGIPVHGTSYEQATQLILEAAEKGKAGFVCHANVHMVMEGYDSVQFAEILERALLVTPDGMPLVWVMRLLGMPDQERVYGPTMMLKICERAEKQGISIGLLGTTARALDLLRSNLHRRFPALQIAYHHAPPFRQLSDEENLVIAREIESSGAKLVFVALGCPKQEKWMAQVTEHVPAILLGVGAAFDFLSGSQKQAPSWVGQLGLEWLFRLCQEPRRLLYRYLKHNPRFVLLATIDVIKKKRATWRRS